MQPESNTSLGSPHFSDPFVT